MTVCSGSLEHVELALLEGSELSSAVQAHLSTCSSCAAQAETLKGIVAALQASSAPVAPAGLAARIVPLVLAVSAVADWTRLLYLYPSDLSDDLIEAILETGVPYFDLSLQHVSKAHLRRMRRWGDADRFIERIDRIREMSPGATFRSNFIVGYPGETERDHDQLLAFVEEAQLDWCGFFAYSPEEGTYAVGLDGEVAEGLMNERLAELRELQDRITATRRDALVGTVQRVLVDRPGVARSTREAPEIDGIIEVPLDLPVGGFSEVEIVSAMGPDLVARSLTSATS